MDMLTVAILTVRPPQYSGGWLYCGSTHHGSTNHVRCVNTPNEEALRLTYQYLMTADGSAALAELQLPEAERSALMQRAAEDASFQPRFLHIFLIGTPGCPAGELPLMDNKSLDSYCVARLEDEHGVLYPLGGMRSRVAYRSTRPAWREGLELPLRGHSCHTVVDWLWLLLLWPGGRGSSCRLEDR